MATTETILKCLKMLAADRAGDLSQERIDLWTAGLEDIPDPKLLQGVVNTLKTHSGDFIPTLAQIRSAALPPVHVDSEAIRREIIAISGYNPNGFVPARVQDVRKRLGDAVADAYGAIGGGSRLFADGTTGDIALRDFSQELSLLVKERGVQALVPPEQPLLLSSHE
jgi:hypothetical protein